MVDKVRPPGLAFYLRLRFCCASLWAVTVKDKDFAALLSGPFDEKLPRLLGELAGLDELASSAEGALNGDVRAARIYVGHYRELTRFLLEAAARTRPELINIDQDGRVEVRDSSGAGGGFIAAVLDETAAEAPFSRWTVTCGLRLGVALHALSSLRLMLPDTCPLDPPSAAQVPRISELNTRRFLFAVRRSLNAQEPPLERIQQVFDLNNTELGRMFRVSRQGAKDWLERGVPTDRHDKVATVAAIADVLERKLKADRIPGLARRPAEAYDGHTMLELIAADRHQELLDITRRSFDWSTAA
jgi:hypothetical protein